MTAHLCKQEQVNQRAGGVRALRCFDNHAGVIVSMNAKTVRAVASACVRNPVALVHPCHYVVGKDGAARGFRWNIDRKRRLLEREI